MNLITLKTFDNFIDAHLLKSKLKSENIDSFLYDENIVTLDPVMSNTFGGIKLKINEFDFEKANEIISFIENKPFIDDNKKVLICPNCNSQKLYAGFKSMKGIKGVLSIIVSFVLLVFPIYQKSVFKCKDCDTEFTYKR
ncbi:DUF2007 domain-containing protein [uncultured Kordia sp.]|uniref:DUF2007 domain-containing protein n=1 Tax=uncultured Kordia sp. TaxID=507699 RepID=UPI002633D9FC|nr:DUF2007 domain-containing protein [uncultured Kordia sp.]